MTSANGDAAPGANILRRIGLVSALLALAAAVTDAAEVDSRAGHGHLSLTYQYIDVNGFEGSMGKVPIGDAETHSLFLEVEYNLTDRWTAIAGVPFVRKRYLGPGPHDPLTLDPPRPWIENVDTGAWNSAFQDFHFGLRYLAKDGPLVVEPYVFLGVPSHEYPFFGHAAVGQHVMKLDVGTSVTWFPGLSNAYYRADLAYVFVEKNQGVSINHKRVNAEVGYQFGPRLTGRVFALWKDGSGLTFPDNFPPPRTTEFWYQHDRLAKHNYLNAGIGVDWALNDRYYLSGNVMFQPWREQVHIMKYAYTLGISRSF